MRSDSRMTMLRSMAVMPRSAAQEMPLQKTVS
jgi:hypothetical protein